jgi:hypothetical protein
MEKVQRKKAGAAKDVLQAVSIRRSKTTVIFSYPTPGFSSVKIIQNEAWWR